MPPLLADFIHIKVCKPNLRKTLDTTTLPIAASLVFLPPVEPGGLFPHLKAPKIKLLTFLKPAAFYRVG